MKHIESTNKKLLTLILAGGKGTRLYPLTKDRTKPAVPFGGSFRIIDFTLSNCLNSGCRNIHILVQYLSATLIRHIWRTWDIFNQASPGRLEVVPPQQKIADLWYRGTADAVFHNLSILEEERPEHTMILSGDHLYRMDYRHFLKVHQETKADVTVGGTKVPLEQGSRFGLLRVDRSGQITQFDEKPEQPEPMPDDPEHCLASMGIYIFRTSVLVKRLLENARRENTNYDFGQDILPLMVKDGDKVQSYNYSTHEKSPYWRDIGTIDSYFDASMDLLQSPPQFDIWDRNRPIRHTPNTLPPAMIGSGSACSQSLLSAGTVLHNCKVSNSIIGPGVHVSPGTEIKDSILLSNVTVGPCTRISRTIIDARVKIPGEIEIGYNPEKDEHLFTISPGGLTLIPTGLPPEEGF